MKRNYQDLAATFQRQSMEALTTPDDPTPAPLARSAPSSYVAPPAPERHMRNLPAMDRIHQVDILPAATVSTVVKTSQQDHSVGFLIRVLPLAVAFAIAAAVIVVGVFEVPALSMKTLITVFCVFAAVFAWAFAKDLDASPAGVALRHTKELWAYLKREQRFQHQWYRDERKEIGKR